MRRLSLCLILWSVVGLALAAPDCPDGSLPPADADLPAYARQLDALSARCAHVPAFLAWQGAVLLRLGRPEDAAELLERALLLAPDHQGARLDYARALAALGQSAAAGDLIAGIAARADAPPAAREFLAAIAPAPNFAPGWQVQGSLALKAGYDSNLNSATSARSLALTLPGGDVVLPLAEASRARAGAVGQAELDLAARRVLAAGASLEIHGRLGQRSSPAHDDLDNRQADLLALWRQPAGDHENAWSLGMGETVWDGRVLQRHWRVGARRDGAFPDVATCRPWAGVDLEGRHHPVAPLLDHRYLQGHLAWVCESDRPWVAQLAVGRESANDRPGGDAWRAAARLVGLIPLADGSRVEAEARLAWRWEDNAYSPLLENGARLQTASLSARLEWRRPLAPGWEASIGLELEKHHANLALFAISRQALTLAAIRRW